MMLVEHERFYNNRAESIQNVIHVLKLACVLFSYHLFQDKESYFKSII